MNLQKDLKEFGFTGKQIKVYTAVLQLGASGATQISRKANIKRTTAYDVLMDLKERGLVSEAKKGGKMVFIPENPENMKKNLEEKKKKLEELLPTLKSMLNTAGTKPTVRYFEGMEGIKEVYRHTLGYKGELVGFVTENITKKLGQDFADEYKEKRKKAQIYVRVIGPETPEIVEYQQTDRKDLKETRLVSPDKFPFSVEMNIYGHNVAFMSFKEQLGVILESSEIANNLKMLFEIAWQGLEKKEEDNYWG